MRKALLVLAIFTLFSFMILSVHADSFLAQSDDITLDSVDIKAVLSTNGTTAVSIGAYVHNIGETSISTISLRIDSLNVEVLTAEAQGTSAEATAINRDRYTEVSIALPDSLEPDSSTWIHLDLRITDLQSELVTGTNPNYLQGGFIFYIRPLNTYSNITFTAVLPVDATLSQESVGPLFPDPDCNCTDGNSLIFSWEIPLLQSGQERAFIVKYQLPAIPSVQTDNYLLQSILFLGLGLVVGAVLTLVFPRLAERLRRITSVRLVGITAEEDTIIETIRRKGGSCNQKELYRGLDMSQSKVSLILSNLEERGLLRRVRDGRENIVELVEEQ
jgi:uncharacterized membrane protein